MPLVPGSVPLHHDPIRSLSEAPSARGCENAHSPHAELPQHNPKRLQPPMPTCKDLPHPRPASRDRELLPTRPKSRNEEVLVKRAEFKTAMWPLEDRIAVLNSIKSCTKHKDLPNGSRIHATVLQRGLIHQDMYISNALISMYAKCGVLGKAQEVFDELPVRDVVSWNALISGYVQCGLGNKALECFYRMPKEGLRPNEITFACILKACSSIGSVEKGEKIHTELQKQKLLEKSTMLATALIDMYAKCGMIERAEAVFDELKDRDVVAWNALISSHAHFGQGHEALKSFDLMQEEGLCPDPITFASVVKACSSIGSLRKGEEIHVRASKLPLLGNDIVFSNSLVDMYAKCGAFANAQEVLEALPRRDVISWTSIINGYVQHELGDKALNCFWRMREEGISPNTVTYACALKACGSIGSSEYGEEIHAEINKKGLLQRNSILGTALVDMYAKCCAVVKAREVFDELSNKDVVAWTALMSGYAQLGLFKNVFATFNEMIADNITPTSITFVILLAACNHAGRVEDGEFYFYTMKNVYFIVPGLEHYTSMVDLFSRAGHFEKAMNLIDEVPLLDRLKLWMALLGGCRKWVNVEIGRWAFGCSMQIDPKHAPAYVAMNNIYAAAGMLEEAKEVEALRIQNGALEIPGSCQWIDGNGDAHSFRAGDRSHPQIHDIYEKLRDISGERVNHSCLNRVSEVISDDQMDLLLCQHSEKLAIACALINTAKDMPIRITKNMGACADCHSLTASISKIEKRKIQVNDRQRIHIFEDGKCICGES